MPVAIYSPRIGIYGPDPEANQPGKGCNLWPAGYSASVAAAEATPVELRMPSSGHAWEDALAGLDGIVLLGQANPSPRVAANEHRMCQWCRENEMPVLAVDRGLHVLNTAFGGTLHMDLPRELPLALQHRHPPEPGVRHALVVTNGTRLAQLYGEGEIVVNSEHTRAVNRVARGFRVSGRALDGVVEAIEAETDGWFAMGVQWHPASVTASGLDIQLFRGLIEGAREYHALAPAHQLAA